MPDITNLNLLWTSLLIESLIRNGCDYFCISPGSRSAPLTVAIARNPQAHKQIFYDERAAAFHALGWAKATGKPAVLVCTSGSAAAHYLPALVEASQDRVPMLVLTSDRPPELIDVGANQAIRQSKLYGDFVRCNYDFPCPSQDVPLTWILSTLQQALHTCLHPEAGPVHLNLPFREPLAPSPQEIPAEYLAGLDQAWQMQTQHLETRETSMDPDEYKHIEVLLQQARQGLLILGSLKPAEQQHALQIANHLRWPVFADALSGLRFDARLETQIASFDQLLLQPDFIQICHFDTILHLGGNYVSGRLLKHLAAHRPAVYIQFQAGDRRQDPNHQVTFRSHASLAALQQMLSLRADATWLANFKRFANAAEAVYAHELDQGSELSEPGLARLISRFLPPGHALMLGNSMPVREADSFAAPRSTQLTVFGNRGTSGIDGHVATATGIATGRKTPVTLLCGDLTLFHDLNSLHFLGQITQPVTVIVVNNSGGGIFSFLPIAEHSDVFEEWFGTPHQLSFAGAAQMFGLDYFAPTSRTELINALETSWNQGKPALIEVRTERTATRSLHRQLQAALRIALETDHNIS